MRHIIELETRLAYHDRILDSLPEAMTEESSGVMPVSPDPVWQYEKEGTSDV
jgi:nuclear cap-binding protein subunit 1